MSDSCYSHSFAGPSTLECTSIHTFVFIQNTLLVISSASMDLSPSSSQHHQLAARYLQLYVLKLKLKISKLVNFSSEVLHLPNLPTQRQCSGYKPGVHLGLFTLLHTLYPISFKVLSVLYLVHLSYLSPFWQIHSHYSSSESYLFAGLLQ